MDATPRGLDAGELRRQSDELKPLDMSSFPGELFLKQL
jgi:hypothetical protein